MSLSTSKKILYFPLRVSYCGQFKIKCFSSSITFLQNLQNLSEAGIFGLEYQLKGLLNLQSLDISFLEFKLAIENYLRNKVPDQLEYKKSSNEGKLRFYNNI
jgi:hypothetical protein